MLLYVSEAPDMSVIGEQRNTAGLQGSLKKKKKKRKHNELLEKMETPIDCGMLIAMLLSPFCKKFLFNQSI